MKVVALIGEPCSGKTTVAKVLLDMLHPGIPFKAGLVVGTKHFEEKVVVLGTYNDEEVFGGTDRMSMAVQPAAEHFFSQLAFQNRDWTIFFEGDRLGNAKFFEFCERFVFIPFLLEAPDHIKTRRHEERKDTQSERFLKSRLTKIRNIKEAYPKIQILPNASKDDLAFSVSKIWESFK